MDSYLVWMSFQGQFAESLLNRLPVWIIWILLGKLQRLAKVVELEIFEQGHCDFLVVLDAIIRIYFLSTWSWGTWGETFCSRLSSALTG